MTTLTQKKIPSTRVQECIRIASSDRSLYVCFDLDNTIWIREQGHEALRYGNWHQALIDTRRELKGPCTVFDPNTVFQAANPITSRRNALKSGKIKGWARKA
jgi:hypothetical protein